MAVLTGWLEAQRAVIGSLLIDPEFCAGEIFQKVTPAMFGDKQLRHVYEAMQSLWISGKPIDPTTALASAGDDYRDLIAACMQATPTAANAGSYADIMRTEARLNTMRIEALAITTAETEEEAAEHYEKISRAMQDTEDIEDLSLTEMIGLYLDRMNDQTPPDYLHFGLPKLDEALAVTPGMFMIIGADSSTGKTALALQFAVHIAKSGKRVGFFSLETPQEPLQNRLMAQYQLAGVPVPLSQQKKLTAEDYRKAAEAGIASETIPLRFIRKAATLEQIRLRTMQRRFQVIFVDYLQLIDCKGKDRYETVTQISMGMHRMAQELGVTVIGLSQITQGEKGKKAKLTVDDLRESRQLKQDADIVLLMSRSDGKDDPAEMRILEIAKNKDGRKARLRLNFEPQHMSFTPFADMNDIRADGRAVREQASVKRKAAEKAEKSADRIPKDLKPGQIVPLPDDPEAWDEIPF